MRGDTDDPRRADDDRNRVSMCKCSRRRALRLTDCSGYQFCHPLLGVRTRDYIANLRQPWREWNDVIPLF